jgi:hypothetical protein
MKHIIILSALSLSLLSFGQGNPNNNASPAAQKWNTDGNQIDTNRFIGTTNEMPFKVRTNNQERFRITPDGKIGVGIMNPIAEFHLGGDLRLTKDVIFEQYADPSIDEKRFLMIDDQGKSNFFTKAQILGGLMADDCYIGPLLADFNSGGFIGGGPVGLVELPSWANTIQNNVPVLWTGVSCGTRVGIGTDNPIERLDVRGKVRASGNIFVGIPGNYSFNNLARIHVVNVSNLASGNKGDFIRFDEMKDGVLETQFLVDQKGFVTARDVKVTLQNIPDYVFKSDYKLPSIAEQSAFIKLNGHLLGVPSEAEMLENQTSLGELSMINLRLNEEQMLYIIDIENQLEELTTENQELKTRLDNLEKALNKLVVND